MSKLKPVFIVSLPTVAVLIVVHSAIRLWQDGLSRGWAGAMVAGGVVALYFGNLYLYRTPRNGSHLTFPTGILAIAAVLAMSDGGLTAVYGFILLVAWTLYVYWYSNLGRDENQLLIVGKPLPSFIVQDTAGDVVESDEWVGQPSLILFYRGNWCPLCIAQIREIATQYQELARRGVQILLISPQPQSHTESLSHKFDVPFIFLVDKDNQAARTLQIAHQDGTPAGFNVMGYAAETVYPTIIITDAANHSIFADLTDNYRLRPEPETFLRIIDELT